MQFQKNQPGEKSGGNERFKRYAFAKAVSVEEDQRVNDALLAKISDAQISFEHVDRCGCWTPIRPALEHATEKILSCQCSLTGAVARFRRPF